MRGGSSSRLTGSHPFLRNTNNEPCKNIQNEEDADDLFGRGYREESSPERLGGYDHRCTESCIFDQENRGGDVAYFMDS